MGSLEDPRVESLEDPAIRHIETEEETKEKTLLKNNSQKPKTKMILESQQALSPVVNQQVVLAGRSPHSGQPSADPRLERQPRPRPCSEQPEQKGSFFVESDKGSVEPDKTSVEPNRNLVESNDNVPTFKVGDYVNYICGEGKGYEAIYDKEHEWKVISVEENKITVETKVLNGWGYYTPRRTTFDASALILVESAPGGLNQDP